MTVPDSIQKAEEAALDATRAAGDLLERLAERTTGKASVTAVFGEPVVAEGVTVIPVATVAFGFGGGTGRDAGAARNADGGGGGGATSARPVGFIEITGTGAVFKPIRDPRREILTSLAAVFAATATAKLVRRFWKR